MRDHLRAGIAIYNAGHYHAAHDAWEDRWLEIKRAVTNAPATVEQLDDADPNGEFPDEPTPVADERLLHGLIQFTAAVHHLSEDNPGGAGGLAESGREYLGPLPADYRGVDVETVRAYLDRVADDPVPVDRVPDLTHEGRALSFGDLDFEATAVAAEVLAEEFGFDEAAVEAGVEYARADLAEGNEESRLVALVIDFVRETDDRGIVARRLGEHADRRRRRERDLEGLF
jgi:predicted metal-dependent hydrolase